jgi:thioredoxin reductase (NADPH)
VFLAQYAAKVFMLVRGPSLAASMARYLIDRIDATPNIELRPHTQLTQLHGDLPGGGAARPCAFRRRAQARFDVEIK